MPRPHSRGECQSFLVSLRHSDVPPGLKSLFYLITLGGWKTKPDFTKSTQIGNLHQFMPLTIVCGGGGPSRNNVIGSGEGVMGHSEFCLVHSIPRGSLPEVLH